MVAPDIGTRYAVRVHTGQAGPERATEDKDEQQQDYDRSKDGDHG